MSEKEPIEETREVDLSPEVKRWYAKQASQEKARLRISKFLIQTDVVQEVNALREAEGEPVITVESIARALRVVAKMRREMSSFYIPPGVKGAS